jgi:lauroyl/myristoyl acyltransferase
MPWAGCWRCPRASRRRIVETNLALCFPDASPSKRRRWLRQTFQASTRAMLEHGVLWWGSEARLRRLVRIDNPEAALGDGVRPVIWLAPHFVGLDMGGVRLTHGLQRSPRCMRPPRIRFPTNDAARAQRAFPRPC